MLVLGSLLCVTTAYARPSVQQQSTKSIIGTVVDTNGDPIIGATVSLNDPNMKVITDKDGHFSFSNVSQGILTISYVGFKTVQEKAMEGKPCKIILKEDAAMLNDKEQGY